MKSITTETQISTMKPANPNRLPFGSNPWNQFSNTELCINLRNYLAPDMARALDEIDYKLTENEILGNQDINEFVLLKLMNFTKFEPEFKLVQPYINAYFGE